MDQRETQCLSCRSKYCPSGQSLHWRASLSKYLGRQQGMHSPPSQKGASTPQTQELLLFSQTLLLGQGMQALLRLSKQWLSGQGRHFSPSKKGLTAGQLVHLRSSRSQIWPLGQERHFLAAKSKYLGKQQGMQVKSSQKQSATHSHLSVPPLQCCVRGQEWQVLSVLLKWVSPVQVVQATPSKKGVEGGQSTHCFLSAWQILWSGQKTQWSWEKSKNLGGSQGMQLVLFQQVEAGHWQELLTTTLPPLQPTQSVTATSHSWSAGQRVHFWPSKCGMVLGQGMHFLKVMSQIWFLGQSLHLRSEQSKQCGWQHYTQEAPLKNNVGSVHWHCLVVGLQLRPAEQFWQLLVEALQKVGEGHCRHRLSTNRGRSSGQATHLWAVRSQISLSGQARHAFCSQSKYLGRKQAMQASPVQKGVQVGQRQSFLRASQLRLAVQIWQASMVRLKYCCWGQGLHCCPSKTGLSGGQRRQVCLVGSQWKFCSQFLQVLALKSKYLGRQQEMHWVSVSKGVAAGHSQLLEEGLNYLPLVQDWQDLEEELKNLGGSQAMQRVGETRWGVAGSQSHRVVSGIYLAPVKQDWQWAAVAFQNWGRGQVVQLRPSKKGNWGGQVSHFWELMLQVCPAWHRPHDLLAKSKQLGWWHSTQPFPPSKNPTVSSQRQLSLAASQKVPLLQSRQVLAVGAQVWPQGQGWQEELQQCGEEELQAQAWRVEFQVCWAGQVMGVQVWLSGLQREEGGQAGVVERWRAWRQPTASSRINSLKFILN